MGSPRLRRLFSCQATTAIVALVLGVVSVSSVSARSATDAPPVAPPDPTRELHEAARSYYLAAEASVNDLDQALMLLHDASDRLGRVTGDPGLQAIAGELSANVRARSLLLDTRHRRLADLSRDVALSLDRHDPQAALDRLSALAARPPAGPNTPQMTDAAVTDCRPASDTHFDFARQNDRAQQDVTAAYGFVRQGDAAARQCADPRGALTAYRQAHDRNAVLKLDERIAAAKACLPANATASDGPRPRPWPMSVGDRSR